MNKNQKQFSKGFTLVETLVAIAMLGYSIATIVVITGQGIFNANYLENKMTAQYLAQEGIEIVRNIRDQQAVFLGMSGDTTQSPITMTGSLLASCIDNWCTVDALDLQNPADSCQGDFTGEEQTGDTVGCPTLFADTQFGGFSYQQGQSTQGFEREIAIIKSLSNDRAYKVVSRVFWNNGSNSISYDIHLYDWFNTVQ